MKLLKILCVSLLSFVSVSYAQTQADTWFDMLYEATKENIPSGTSIAADKKSKIIYISVKLPISSKDAPFDTEAAKKGIIKHIKNTPDAKFIKGSSCSIIYCYITTDNKSYSVIINTTDL